MSQKHDHPETAATAADKPIEERWPIPPPPDPAHPPTNEPVLEGDAIVPPSKPSGGSTTYNTGSTAHGEVEKKHERRHR